jgi:hypothetical protein
MRSGFAQADGREEQSPRAEDCSFTPGPTRFSL